MSNLVLGNHLAARLLRDRVILPLMNKASLQQRVWDTLSQLKVTYRNGPLGRQAPTWPSSPGPRPGRPGPRDRLCPGLRRRTTLHGELGHQWALVLPDPILCDQYQYTAVVANRLGDHAMTTLVADQDPNQDILLVGPDAHLGWRGRPDPDTLDQWLTTIPQHRRTS
jgi:4,5-epoxidase